MKMIIAYIRPEQLPDVKDALFEADIKQFSATTVMGTAPKTEQRMYRGVKREVSLFRRVRLEIILHDEKVEASMEAIAKGSKESGGAGRIFVTDVVDALKPWTGERGEAAL